MFSVDMSRILKSIPNVGSIAFVGNYLPRACGIATFTYDLAESMAESVGDDGTVITVALSDKPGSYAYPDRVKFEIHQDSTADYEEAARFINTGGVDIVSLQHEYGIFGGESGSNVLVLLEKLRCPVVVTFHTVYKEPSPMQKEVLTDIATLCSKLVVMSRKGMEFLMKVYGITKDKIVFIPHGVHDVPFLDTKHYKSKLRLKGNVLLTFGLLHKSKGIEYMIDALSVVLRKHPRTTYVILGATHPRVMMLEGENYRRRLQKRVKQLKLEEHVLFYPRFLYLRDLLDYLGAADIFVTPYSKIEYITSGALAYALASGKAVVSTPYWYAQELLSEGRGCLVPKGDSQALARAIIELLDDRDALHAIRRKAYAYGRRMIWSEVACSYLHLFASVLGRGMETYRSADLAARTAKTGRALND
jgi:glycosyltransferase involved in cell wall biosynthesis